MEVKIHENTINNKISEIIRDSKLFEVNLFEGITLPSGERRELDFRLVNYDICGEGEWESTQFIGYDQANNFLKVPGAKAAFLILYPDKIKYWNELDLNKLKELKVNFCFLRPSSGNYIKKHKIKEIPYILKKNIEEILEDVDLKVIIETIRQAVSYMQATIDSTKMNNIFINNLFAEEKVKTEVAIKSAAYFLLNQLIFYRIMASSPKYKKELNYINPNDIQNRGDLDEKYFEVLKEITLNYKAIYNISISYLINEIEPLRKIITFVNTIAPERIDGDFLGKVFHQLIPKDIRKKVASYYTLEESAYILATLAIEKYDELICDPACGSGTLLCAAYNRKRELLSDIREFKNLDHRKFLSDQILGADIMPFAAHLSVIHLALQDLRNFTDDVQIAVLDSNKLKIGYEISSLPDSIQKSIVDFIKTKKTPEGSQTNKNKKSRTIRDKVIDVDGVSKKKIIVKSQDTIIMNPPFTKKQSLAIESNLKKSKKKQYKDELLSYYQDFSNKNLLNKKSPFFAFFLCLADKLLLKPKNEKSKKTLAAVLPAIILRNDNERNLRDYLIKNYWFKYIIVREDASNFSEDTNLREILLILEKRLSIKSKERRKVTYIFLNNLNSNNFKSIPLKIVNVIEQIELKSHTIYTHNNWSFSLLQIPQDELKIDNLFEPISLFSYNYDYLRFWNKIRMKKPFKKFLNFENLQIKSKNSPEPTSAKLKFRGTSFLEEKKKKDKNDMILLEENEKNWIVQLNDAPQTIVQIPKDKTKPVLRYVSKKDFLDISNLKEYVIYENHETIDFPNDANWQIWQEYLDDRTANLVIVDRLNYIRPGFNFLAFFSETNRIISRTTAAITGISLNQAKIGALWFNSSFGIIEWLMNRSPQEFGYCQHHIFTLEQLCMIDVEELEKDDYNNLLTQIGNYKFPSLMDQYLKLMKNDFKIEYSDILEKYELLDIINSGFEPRIQLDKYILKIIINSLNKNDLLSLSKILLNDNSLDTKNLKKELLTDKYLMEIIYNIQKRIAKILIDSKIAMEK